MKKIRSAVAMSTLAVALVPFFAGAQSVADLQSQIQTLIAQIASYQQENGLPAQTGTLPPISTSTVSDIPIILPTLAGQSAAQGPAPYSGLVCPIFRSTLSRGSRGGAVSALQTFLVVQGLLATDSITGFYGPVTEAAIKGLQAQQNIVSSGDATTTGWGVVGARTSALITKLCAAHLQPAVVTSSSSCQAVLPPSSACVTGWTPNLDARGCTNSFTCTTIRPQTALPTFSTSTQSQSLAPTSTTCPYYPIPACMTGTSAQWQGNDSRGCSLGYWCVNNPSPIVSGPVLSCPNYDLPICNGTLVAQGTDANGCQLAARCIATPTVSAPMAGSCTFNGTTYPNGTAYMHTGISSTGPAGNRCSNGTWIYDSSVPTGL